jgi:hypothetical protein
MIKEKNLPVYQIFNLKENKCKIVIKMKENVLMKYLLRLKLLWN